MAAPISLLPADLTAINDACFDTVIDARSPAEFLDDHVPGAINLPVLDNGQRAEIGTLYKQVNPFTAKRTGAALVARNIAHHLETTLHEVPSTWRPLVYCWRGGQRSGAVAKVFSDIGWRTSIIEGGYKAYRRAVLDILNDIPSKLRLIVIAGKTGTAKTRILRAAAVKGLQIIDLERLANHRGSLLGREPGSPQPSQRLFESRLAKALLGLSSNRSVFVEAESNKIGEIHVPPALWAQMRSAKRITVEAPLTARIKFLMEDYDHVISAQTDVVKLLSGLQTRYSTEIFDSWKNNIKTKNWEIFVESLLTHHYDPSYNRSSASRASVELKKFYVNSLDARAIDNLVQQLMPFNIFT